MSGIEPKQLKDKIKNLRFRWKQATTQYISTYPDFALGLDKVQNSRALKSVETTKVDIHTLQAELVGLLATTGNFINYQSGKIDKAKKKYNNSRLDLETVVGNNKSGTSMKIDKYNQNSKAYILASYYTIGILSTSYFIYKQLKQ